jgi:hypothetical protein
VDIDFPSEFAVWLDRLDSDAEAGDERARLVRQFVLAALALLRDLDEVPEREDETAELKWVRQSRRYPLWRVSHHYHPDVAVRLICWFPPKAGTVVVTLFAGDKKRIGDVWYDSVAPPADGLIEQWMREAGYEQ